MCEALEKLISKEKQEASAKTLANNIMALISGGYSVEEACRMLHSTVDEYLAAKKLLEEYR